MTVEVTTWTSYAVIQRKSRWRDTTRAAAAAAVVVLIAAEAEAAK